MPDPMTAMRTGAQTCATIVGWLRLGQNIDRICFDLHECSR
jgi:hypothetical protein